jgi:hypothetical protein
MSSSKKSTWKGTLRHQTLNVVYTGVFNTVPEIIDPVFAKTSQNARFLLSENERFGLVFVKTGSINSGTGDTVSYIGIFDPAVSTFVEKRHFAFVSI